jgi:hypothetical protein
VRALLGKTNGGESAETACRAGENNDGRRLGGHLEI